MLAAWSDPRLSHGERRRIVLVEHLAPLVVDVVHFVAVDHRMGAVFGLIVGAPDHIIVQIIAVEILGQAVRHVHAEAVGTVVKPETQGFDGIGAHVLVFPVPVRLFLGEHVQIPLAVGHARPCRAAEVVLPVGRRLVAVRSLAVAEDVAVAFRRAGFRGQRGLEPFVQVGAVVRHDVHDDFDAVGMRGFGERVEIVHAAEFRIDVAVVVHVIAAVGQLGRVERAQPDGVDAQFLQISDFLGDAGDLAEALAAGILEGTWIHLVDHGLLPPQRRIVDFGHVVPFHTNACAPCARITTPYVERFSLIFLRWLCCVV